MNRRRWVLGGVAAAAMAAGAGGAWWRERQVHEASAGLWTMRFPSPDGGTVDLSALRGAPLVLNFWATWCPPCVKEMPDLDRFWREHRARGWQVVGLAIDQAAPVREFLARQPVGFPIGLAGFEGTALSRNLGNATGALPFTVILGAGGRPLHRHMGATTADQLRTWAAELA